jgi:WD40 repeat protein
MAAPLNLQSCIGFQGQTAGGLILHADGHTMIYPLGSTIVLRDKKDPKAQEFLQGHTNSISCLALSPSGRYLASGQITYMGFTADIIIWDVEARQLLHRLQLQKGSLQCLGWQSCLLLVMHLLQ